MQQQQQQLRGKTMTITKLDRDNLRDAISELSAKHSGIFNEASYFDKQGDLDFIIYHFELNSDRNFINITFENLDTGLYQLTSDHVPCIKLRIDFNESLDYLLDGIGDVVNNAHLEILYKAGCERDI